MILMIVVRCRKISIVFSRKKKEKERKGSLIYMISLTPYQIINPAQCAFDDMVP